MKPDGSIIINTKIDNSGLKNAGKSIKSALSSTTKAVAAFGAATVAAIGTVITKSVEAFADYEQLTGGVETLFKTSADKVKQYASEAYKTVGISSNEYMQTVTSFSASLISSLGGDTDKAADIANMALIDMADNANKMGSSLESIQTAYQGFAKQQYMLLDNLKLGYGGTKTEMERLLKDAQAYSKIKYGEDVVYDIDNLSDVYTAISRIQEKLEITGTTAKEAATTIAGSSNMMKASWQNVLSAISGGGDLDAAINNFVDSFVTYFDNVEPAVERALLGIGQLIEKIGPKLVSVVSSAVIKAIPGLLAAVYQMIISLAQGISQGIKELFFGGPKEVLEQQAEEIAKSVENQEALTQEVKNTDKALKKSLAGFDEINTLGSNSEEESQVTQNVNLSVSGISEADGGLDDGLVTQISSKLAELMTIIGEAAVAVGVILLFSGNIAWGIGFIVFGAASMGVGMGSLSKETVSQNALTTLTSIMGAVAGALVAIGIILITVGSVALGIGFISAGAIMLGVTVFQIAKFSTDPIKNMLITIEAIAGGALLALGILLLYFGANKPLAIGAIVAGAALIVTAVAQIVAGAVSDEVAAWIYGITAIVSTALLVIGVIMLCCGMITPLSIGLVVAGAAGLATTIALNWNAIVDWIKNVWNKVKEFWNKHIAPIFTVEFWKNLAKKCGNGLIAGFEGAVNGIISIFEKMINWVVSGLNKISFDVPDWVPLIGGKKFGFNIPEAKFGRVSIPRLAQGAVIPPNREFMAVLGDQKRGTNIEAPLDTIKQALAEVLALQGGGGETVVSVNFTGDLAQLARVLKPAIETETRRRGGSLARGATF